jgi:hypothetical protein
MTTYLSEFPYIAKQNALKTGAKIRSFYVYERYNKQVFIDTIEDLNNFVQRSGWDRVRQANGIGDKRLAILKEAIKIFREDSPLEKVKNKILAHIDNGTDIPKELI